MRRPLFVVFVLCLVMTLGFGANLAIAQVRSVGVSEGDWFKYSLTFDWSFSNPNATIPADMKLYNETEWLWMSVIDVVSTNITTQSVAHLKNGTEITRVPGGSIDVDTGSGMAPWAISANLNLNDSLYTSGELSAWKIEETIPRTYPSDTRDTNHVTNTTEYNYPDEVNTRASRNCYWDRSTGIIVEMILDIQRTEADGSQTNMTSIVLITESNVWTISESMPEFPTWMSMQLILIALAVAILFYRRRLERPIH